MPFLFLLISVGAAKISLGQASAPAQMAAAVLPLPEAWREGAGVRLFTPPNTIVSLRPSRNGMMCTIVRPTDDEFDVRCYAEEFLKVMDRAREISRESGADTALARRRLDEEIKSGRVHLPDHPTAGYRMLGPMNAYDARTNSVTAEIDKWQSVHFPFKTAAELHLPTEPDGTMPFVMASGTWWSHVMIVHAPVKDGSAGRE
jgi:hypothetical protein